MSNNSMTAIPLWIATSVVVFVAVQYYSQPHMLMVMFFSGVVAYKLIYRLLYRRILHVKLSHRARY